MNGLHGAGWVGVGRGDSNKQHQPGKVGQAPTGTRAGCQPSARYITSLSFGRFFFQIGRNELFAILPLPTFAKTHCGQRRAPTPPMMGSATELAFWPVAGV